MLEKMIINSARKAMLDNISALDKKTLQRELESHLKLEFKYKDELDQLTNNWNKLEEWVKKFSVVNYNCDEIIVHEQIILNFVLAKMKEIKEKNNG